LAQAILAQVCFSATANLFFHKLLFHYYNIKRILYSAAGIEKNRKN